MAKDPVTDRIRRIQWGNSDRPRITIYTENGVLMRLDHPKAIEAFNTVLYGALQAVFSPEPDPED